MIELKTNTWYKMKPNYKMFFSRESTYIKIFIYAKYGENLNYFQHGVHSFLPRFMTKKEFLENVDCIATEEELSSLK